MKSKGTDKRQNYSRIQRILYSLIVWIVPLLFIALFEIFLRLVGYGEDFRLFVDAPHEELGDYKICNPQIGRKYFQKLDYTSSMRDVFLKTKPENGYRIFVLGSSTVAGFPYERNLSFPVILQQRLQDMYPARTIEVVNVAMTAVGSFTLVDFMDDILGEEPDALLFYAGHNEFYGALGLASREKIGRNRFLILLHLRLMDFRFYQWMRDAIAALSDLNHTGKPDPGIRGTLMSAIANDKAIPYEGKLYQKAIHYFRKNLTVILTKARKKNVPVFLSDVVSNIRDLEPFSSVDWGDWPRADSLFFAAKDLEKGGHFALALEKYRMARDLDGTRFRASGHINQVIAEEALRFGAIRIPMEQIFEDHSDNRLVGNAYFTEHVHPTIDGQFLMADAFYQSIIQSKLIGNFNPVLFQTSAYYQRNWGYTAFDSLLALHKVDALMHYWPFRPKDVSENSMVKNDRLSFIDSLVDASWNKNPLEILNARKQWAVHFFEKKRYEDAFRAFYAIHLIDPFYEGAYMGMIESLMQNNDFPEAARYIRRFPDRETSFFPLYYRSIIASARKDYSEALSDLNRALNYADTRQKKWIYMQMMAVQRAKGQEKEAREISDMIAVLYPGESPEPVPELQSILSVIPTQVGGYIREALQYLEEGEQDLALEKLRQSLRIKETPLANRVVGEILFERNEKNAIIHLLKAFPDCKNDPDFLSNLCLYNIRNRDFSRAEEFLKQIRIIDPAYPGAQSLAESLAAAKILPQ
ncbi:MAG TPA: hypothetical protein PLK12_11190 [Prolixibacteraceae bacterium]|nr:hypothetical protein [Prolixibacteraceae bacterium]